MQKGVFAVITSILPNIVSNLLFFALHIDSANLFPHPLSPDEEAECFRRMKNGDSEARGRLIEHNLRLVAHIIKKYYSAAGEQDDLISIGSVGLIKAVSTFDYEKGTRFATYASKCIENEILMHFRAKKKSSGDLCMDAPIDTDKDGNTITLMDIIADTENMTEKIENSLNAEKLYSVVPKCLKGREFDIIVMRYGLYGGRAQTQREVAKVMGISRSYVSRIEKRALEKLRSKMDL